MIYAWKCNMASQSTIRVNDQKIFQTNVLMENTYYGHLLATVW